MPYFFELPDISELTLPQQKVLNHPGSVSVYGGPGTGKSITSLWRHIRNYDTNSKESLLLTYTVSLVAYLSGAARPINEEAADHIKKTQFWLKYQATTYEEIIIDEAQDLPAATYNEIRKYAAEISYGADDQQSLYPGQATSEAELKRIFSETQAFPLDENFRNSFEILKFVRATLPDKVIPQITMDGARQRRTTGIKPRILVTNGILKKQNDAILALIESFYSENHNIGILVPFTDDVNAMYNLVAPRYACTKYHNKITELPLIENIHITTYASAKGIEFDTLIMPQFEKMRDYIRTKYGASEKHYYVSFTRAKTNLFLISDVTPTDIHASTYELEIL
ncbi:DNA/RNA helicase domain-containing protein [Sphingobacterium faecium]|uniref:DNA/RNA helicase domain-containing protein n=1 Tax=Sphingobacterium faecium TaxID=34087 RepID=UPI0032095AED